MKVRRPAGSRAGAGSRRARLDSRPLAERPRHYQYLPVYSRPRQAPSLVEVQGARWKRRSKTGERQPGWFPAKQVQQTFKQPAARLRSLAAIVSPRQRTICQTRKTRKEVLFALNVAGRRGSAPGGKGGYRRNALSKFSCGG